MLDRGAKRKPLSVLKLVGSKCAKGRTEPPAKIFIKPPRPPDELDSVAQAKWKETAAILVSWGVLADSDLDCLEIYCHAYSVWRTAAEHVRKHGPIVKGKWGDKCNPAMDVQERAAARMDRLATYLGLTPSSRSKLSPAIPKDAQSKKKYFRRSNEGA